MTFLDKFQGLGKLYQWWRSDEIHETSLTTFLCRW